MTCIGLLMVSVLYLSNQQTRIAVEQAYLEDKFNHFFQLPNSLVMAEDEEDNDENKKTSRKRGGRRQRNRRGRDETETPSKALAVQYDNEQEIRKRKWHAHRPPLSSLIRDTQAGIKGDVSPLLDFAILGHAKCATSFIMNWLSVHPEIQIFDEEVCDLNERRPAEMVRKLYEELPTGDYKRGFKCPGHFSRGPVRDIRKYFKNAKLIVGLRHPVRWFESFYNFRYRHPVVKVVKAGGVLPEAEQLIGDCTTESQGVCTARAEFHGNLAMFAKTNLTDPEEWKLMRLRDKYQRITPIDNPIFLYDVNQLYDSNETRTTAFKADLRDFLGVKADMPEPVKEGKAQKPKFNKMDICEPRYEALRLELLDAGERASIWIIKYFMESDQVVVSSPDFFKEILQDWKVDPCTAVQKQAME
jgi:hypothetical protein